MSSPLMIDRGEPLDPAAIGPRVYQRRRHVPMSERDAFEKFVVVVHPEVYEDAFMRVHELSYWTEHPVAGRLGDLRCCGLLVTSDPGLRLDEVRLRREESL